MLQFSFSCRDSTVFFSPQLVRRRRALQQAVPPLQCACIGRQDRVSRRRFHPQLSTQVKNEVLAAEEAGAILRVTIRLKAAAGQIPGA
jgi:hypothetical protein